MNERGEITLFCSLLIFACMGLVLLCGLELTKSFKDLEKRTELFLCAKETKGEFHSYMTFMGRTNWGIQNVNRAGLILLFIPGAQGLAMDTQKLKIYLKRIQTLKLATYLKTLSKIRKKGCPLDTRIFLTPFKLSTSGYQRDAEGAAILRSKKWNYYFLSKPYLLSLNIDASSYESVRPNIIYMSEEKGARLSSLLSLR